MSHSYRGVSGGKMTDRRFIIAMAWSGVMAVLLILIIGLTS